MSAPVIFQCPTVAGFDDERFERALRRVHWQQTHDARALACVLALSCVTRLMGVEITKGLLVPIGSFN